MNHDLGLIELLKEQDLEFSMKKLSPEKNEDAALRRFKDKLLFIATLLIIVSVMLFSMGYVILKPDSTTVGLAFNGLFGLTMLLAGYSVKK